MVTVEACSTVAWIIQHHVSKRTLRLWLFQTSRLDYFRHQEHPKRNWPIHKWVINTGAQDPSCPSQLMPSSESDPSLPLLRTSSSSQAPCYGRDQMHEHDQSTPCSCGSCEHLNTFRFRVLILLTNTYKGQQYIPTKPYWSFSISRSLHISNADWHVHHHKPSWFVCESQCNFVTFECILRWQTIYFQSDQAATPFDIFWWTNLVLMAHN